MTWIRDNYLQISAVLGVIIMLTVGRAQLLPAVRNSTPLLWLAFVVTVACGLVLGWALSDVVSWLTHLSGGAGAVLGSIGALIALTLGWHAAYLLVALIRDVADKKPDEEARKAALWVPLFLPAGWSGVWGIVSHPRGLGTGVVAAVMAGITIRYVHRIVKAALAGKTGKKAWQWFAAAVCLLGGLVMIPLVTYVDTQASHWSALPAWGLTMARIVLGAVGLALLIAACVDIKDRVPDEAVRAFLSYGFPVLTLFGLLAVGYFGGHAHDGLQILTGVSK